MWRGKVWMKFSYTNQSTKHFGVPEIKIVAVKSIQLKKEATSSNHLKKQKNKLETKHKMLSCYCKLRHSNSTRNYIIYIMYLTKICTMWCHRVQVVTWSGLDLCVQERRPLDSCPASALITSRNLVLDSKNRGHIWPKTMVSMKVSHQI